MIEDNAMITLINIIICVFILYAISIQINMHNDLIFDKYRFKYFALRDRLALLVIKGDIEEKSWEYQYIIDAINFHIQTVETMSIDNILRLLVEYHNSPERDTVEIIKGSTDNKEVIKIMIEFLEVTSAIVNRNSKIQLKATTFVRSMKKKPGLLEKPAFRGAPEIKFIQDSKVALEKMRTIEDSLRGNLAGTAPA